MKPLLLLMLTVSQMMAQTAPEIGLIPWPRDLKLSGGRLELTSGTRIVHSSGELQSLAEVLSQELYQITSKRFAITGGEAKAGDIVLEIDPALPDETHTLEVGTQVVITASNYKNTAMATSSLLQAVSNTGAKVLVPKLSLKDCPHSWYRSLMVDVARQPHTIDTLKQCVVLCRIYKVSFLQLHLTDEQLLILLEI